MIVRRCIKAAMRGTAVGFAQTWLFIVGVPLALLCWTLENLAEVVGVAARWCCRESERLSAWQKDAIRRDIKGVQR